jgi:hypothetical protein
MSANCDPLVRGQTSAGQSPARICVAYNIAVRNFLLVRFEGAERVQQIFEAVDNSRGPRPARAVVVLQSMRTVHEVDEKIFFFAGGRLKRQRDGV